MEATNDAAYGEIASWVTTLVLLAISWGLARLSRVISTRRELKRGERERKLTDFSSMILYFTFLMLGLILFGWLVLGPSFDATPPPNAIAISVVLATMVLCGVLGFSLEAGKRWAIGGVFFISALAIGAFIWSMVMTGIVRVLALGLILLYLGAIAASIALSKASLARFRGTPQT